MVGHDNQVNIKEEKEVKLLIKHYICKKEWVQEKLYITLRSTISAYNMKILSLLRNPLLNIPKINFTCIQVKWMLNDSTQQKNTQVVAIKRPLYKIIFDVIFNYCKWCLTLTIFCAETFRIYLPEIFPMRVTFSGEIEYCFGFWYHCIHAAMGHENVFVFIGYKRTRFCVLYCKRIASISIIVGVEWTDWIFSLQFSQRFHSFARSLLVNPYKFNSQEWGKHAPTSPTWCFTIFLFNFMINPQACGLHQDINIKMLDSFLFYISE